ncbi:methionine ABC transporter permease [Hathewaya limosa]|uniref:D-methionine transport system permease protein n=1 Tax=Hathewaya limosa TaxID=1536 RepID=A0ABU0JTL1_HATLI|nr:methionine ABC transporter permease [Hathewaya limosa]MDQ0480433.1 D-methionine transport system permease protein [Hathewaya limosa]
MKNILEILYSIPKPLLQTLYMVSISTLFSLILGLPLGIILRVTSKGHILENSRINKILDTIVNIFRSVPFIILIVALFPISKILVGTTIGSTAAIVPLSIAATPFVARIIDTSLGEVPYGLIEAALSMGANNFEIIFKVMLKEALPSLISGITLTIINIIGYSAMAGAIGGEGIGDYAIREGYMRYNNEIILITIVVLIILVQIIQSTGNYFTKKFDKR